MASQKGEADAYVALARIGRARGVDGEFLVWALADDYERFYELTRVYLVRRDKRVAAEVESFRVVSGRGVMKVKGVDAPEQVRLWVNGYIEIDETDRVRLPEGTYFQDDLVGLRVVSEDGELLGTIEQVMGMPAHDVYACRTPDGREVLIPAVENVVLKIDPDAGKIVVFPMPGLFD